MDFIGIIAVPVLVAATTAFFTTEFALRRFRSERWWERTVDAYASILEALHVMKRRLEDEREQMAAPNRRTDEGAEIEQRRKYRAAQDEVRKAVDTASFLLSPQVAPLLRKLKGDLAVARRDYFNESCDGFSAITSEIDVIQGCLDRLSDIARRDLRIPGAFRWGGITRPRIGGTKDT